jgi:NAD(P)H-hydrate repair Nnr-like enzyme with NAD(P)H-hydrate epimerase domain
MGRTILTAGEMRAAEAQAIEAGAPVETLMERAGMAAAQAIRLFAGESEALILCGPGKQWRATAMSSRGHCASGGMNVRVAALGEPRSAAAGAARQAWAWRAALMEAGPAPLLVERCSGTD